MRQSLVPSCVLAVGIGVTSPAPAQPVDGGLEALRDIARQAFDPSRTGSFYAASINFAVQPDIATANFSLDGQEDVGAISPELVNTKLPLRYTFGSDADGVRPFVQGAISYQDISIGLPFNDSVIHADWRSRGINVGSGIEYRLSDRWQLLPSVNLGLADLQNKADYGDGILGEIFQPVFEGIVFDWETRAWVAGAALGARYERQYGSFRLLTNLSASANYIRSFDESSPDIRFRETASALDVAFNTIHPVGRLGDTQVDLVTVLGATSLVGNARGELGFDDFAEIGLAIQFDIRRFGLAIDGLRIGAKAIVGPDVSGWSLVIGQGL